MRHRTVTYLGIAFLIASTVPVAAGEGEPHWSYTGEEGPEHWAELSPDDYTAAKADLIDTTLDALDRYVPNVRARLAHVEAATPRTFEHYTGHAFGASFGTKFEGLEVSRGIPHQIGGLYHAGSVGIIMSGWLGTINYGVIVANDVDAYLMDSSSRRRATREIAAKSP